MPVELTFKAGRVSKSATKEEVLHLQKQLIEANRTIEQSRIDLTIARGQAAVHLDLITQAESRSKKVEAENADLRAQLHTAHGKIESQTLDIRTIRINLEEVNGSFAESKREFEQEVRNLEAENAEFKAQLEEMSDIKAENTRLQSELHPREAVSKLGSQNWDMLFEIVEHRREYLRIRNDLESWNQVVLLHETTAAEYQQVNNPEGEKYYLDRVAEAREFRNQAQAELERQGEKIMQRQDMLRVVRARS